MIKKALEQGYSIQAFAREPIKLDDIVDSRIQVITGNLSDYAEIKNTIQGTVPVISVMEPTGTTIGTPMINGVKNIIKAMQETGVKRLIYLSAPSFRTENDGTDSRFDFSRWLIKNFNETAYDNIVEPSRLIAESPLDYTLVRIPVLTDTIGKRTCRDRKHRRQSSSLILTHTRRPRRLHVETSERNDT